MRYQVPQFIEVEDKIFGPLTFKQFVYIVGGGGMAFVFYKFLNFFIAIPFIAASLGLGFALAFYKVNGKPFINVMESAFRYSLGNKLYIWHKTDRKVESKTTTLNPAASASVFVPKLSDSKLKDLTWSLDINETISSQEEKNK